MNLHLVASVFAIIFVAELPDKTALASLVLATRHKPLPVFVGAALALTVQSVVAVAAGHLLGLLPPRTVHIASGVLFLASAIVMWMRKSEVGGREVEGGGADPAVHLLRGARAHDCAGDARPGQRPGHRHRRHA